MARSLLPLSISVDGKTSRPANGSVAVELCLPD
jgi:hypothetical protein